MFAQKIFLVLVLAYLAKGSDLDVAYDMMACAKRAITDGVDELDIPSHSPIHAKTNLSWTGDISVASITINLTNIVWAGLPTWEVNAVQLNDDSDDYAVFNFRVYWREMTIAADYSLVTQELIFQQVQKGTLELEFEVTDWSGSINVTKPGRNLTETVNDVQIDWTVSELDAQMTGLGLFNGVYATAIATALQTALNTKIVGNVVGEFIQYRLNTIWWSTGKIWKLCEWCENNPANITSY